MVKRISYLTIFLATLLFGISVVKAEDYAFGVKVYKVENVSTFLEDYKNRNVNEVTSGRLDAGDIIAVSICEKVYNSYGSIFDLRLNWDDSVLEPLLNSDGNTYGEVDWTNYRDGGIFESSGNAENDWSNTIGGYSTNYYRNNIPRVSGTIYSIDDYRILYSGSLGFLYFKVKDNVVDNTILTFSYNKAEVYGWYGRVPAISEVKPVSFIVKSYFYAPYSLKGDINGNGKIDYGDVQMIIGYVGRTLNFNSEEMSAADVTGDGNVNILDQVKLINMYDALD